MLNSEFKGIGNDLDFYPPALRSEIDRINDSSTQTSTMASIAVVSHAPRRPMTLLTMRCSRHWTRLRLVWGGSAISSEGN